MTYLSSIKKRFADLRLPSPYFRLMINQNLRLPIIEPGTICPCGQEIDIYGDLFFSMQKIQQNATKQPNPAAIAYILSLLKLVNMQVSFPANEMYSQNP
jgi:hypothetical protein